jgi:hypothetical protein
MLIKKTLVNWYHNDVSFSIELIESFVKGIEKEAEESILRYEKEKQRELLLEDSASENEETCVTAIETHQGLDSESWNLDTIFHEYFPSLQRRSGLLTVYAHFEHELDKLCSFYQSEKIFKLALSDLRGRGIDRSTSYLEKIAGIDVHKESKEWTHIKRIQSIRNNIVHQGGRTRDRQGNPIKEVIDAIDKSEFVNGDDEVVLNEGFLGSVVATYKRYFWLLHTSIVATEKGRGSESNQTK